MDHNGPLRKLERLMGREANQALDVAIELEALVSLLPSEKAQQCAHLQIEASHVSLFRSS